MRLAYCVDFAVCGWCRVWLALCDIGAVSNWRCVWLVPCVIGAAGNWRCVWLVPLCGWCCVAGVVYDHGFVALSDGDMDLKSELPMDNALLQVLRFWSVPGTYYRNLYEYIETNTHVSLCAVLST